MTKKYENPMLQIISIKNNDILTNSIPVSGETSSWGEAADRFRDSWDAGY
ncbi:MAG: hypothetical protein J6T19_05360 [Paludibacteraceae bacterium]|nr:hypothetical protein [Paludibacteraceae bacterium]